MANLAEVINKQHDKLNTHTTQIATLQDHIAALQKRQDALETRTKHLSTFADTLDGWLSKIKELV